MRNNLWNVIKSAFTQNSNLIQTTKPASSKVQNSIKR